ncbi:beta-phosphoglucomutase family hydrolase [Gordonia defluvii]|uniref:Beta-phosphoglucomutase n=1 Tax=Gordonia defluvii TaxID=283718 RepID=A0ABN3YE21_9ACTN|nr:beta-phosphoglucomutase family hydrolase [Gordonia sp. UBA5067]
MLGLPESVTVALFDLDGVLTDTASVHLTAWTEAFNNLLPDIVDDDGHTPAPFTESDYRAHVDGRPREDGINAFLAARRITVDPDTVAKLGQAKNRRFLAILDRDGVTPYPDAVAYLHAARDAGLGIAVVTSSRNGGPVLEAAGLTEFVAVRVDGNDIVERHLAGKPAPDSFLLGAELMGVGPAGAAVFEDAVSGVAAGSAGDFAAVIGVDRTTSETQPSPHAKDLAGAGATDVVTSLDRLRIGGQPEGAPQ